MQSGDESGPGLNDWQNAKEFFFAYKKLKTYNKFQAYFIKKIKPPCLHRTALGQEKQKSRKVNNLLICLYSFFLF